MGLKIIERADTAANSEELQAPGIDNRDFMRDLLEEHIKRYGSVHQQYFDARPVSPNLRISSSLNR